MDGSRPAPGPMISPWFSVKSDSRHVDVQEAGGVAAEDRATFIVVARRRFR
jgi:hypothetical protein